MPIRSQVTHNLPHDFSLPSDHPEEESIPRINSPTGTNQEIDVGGLLLPLFGIILCLVWYCRITYAMYFTTAATVALAGLSSLCVFSFFAFRYPETLH